MVTHAFYVIKDGDFFLYLPSPGSRWGMTTFPQDAFLFVHKESAEMTAASKPSDMKNPKVVAVTMTFEE